jgi:hypothetical protein
MNNFEPKLKEYCDEFVRAIRRVAESDGQVEFKDWFHRLAFDVFFSYEMFSEGRSREGFLFRKISVR